MLAVALSPDSPDLAIAYCRQARRLRARYSKNRGQLHIALQTLSGRHDRAAARLTANGNPQQATNTFSDRRWRPNDYFAHQVRASLVEGVLRYSDRQRLLAEAAGRGVERFEANLIIAAVQHSEAKAAKIQKAAEHGVTSSAILLVITLLQAGIVYAAWWVFHF